MGRTKNETAAASTQAGASEVGGASIDEASPAKQAKMTASGETTQPPKNEVGKEHDILKRSVGKWDVDCTFIMGGQESKNLAKGVTREMVLGGRFLKEKFNSDMDGFQFEGEMMMGCFEGEFQGTWMDNMSNQIFFSKGKLIAESPDFEIELVSAEPVRDHSTGRPKRMRQRHISPSNSNEFIFEAYDTFLDDGVEKLTMRMVYRRVPE